jgi:hypothetical protein
MDFSIDHRKLCQLCHPRPTFTGEEAATAGARTASPARDAGDAEVNTVATRIFAVIPSTLQ